jgi:hypothetical protein
MCFIEASKFISEIAKIQLIILIFYFCFSRESWAPELNTEVLGWIHTVLGFSDKQLIDSPGLFFYRLFHFNFFSLLKGGVDAVIYLKFLTLTIRLVLLLMLFGLVIILPVNYFAQKRVRKKSFFLIFLILMEAN